MAQLDRASDYGSEGWGFESSWARQNKHGTIWCRFYYVQAPGFATPSREFEPQQKGRRKYAGLRQQILQGRRSQSSWARHKFKPAPCGRFF